MSLGIWKRLKSLGPGFITGAADDDPSGIATYAQAGAGFGFGQLWTLFFSVPLMIAVQEMSARIALVTGHGLIRTIVTRYSKWFAGCVALLLIIANTINIGADLGMMASAAQSIVPLPFGVLLCAMGLGTFLLQIFLSYKIYAKYLKWLTISLFAYVFVAFIVRLDWSDAVFRTLWPEIQWTSDYWMVVVAVFGTTVSPYLYFWQANQEVEEEKERGHIDSKGVVYHPFFVKELRRMRFDTSFGMVFSNLVAWFIVVTTAATLFHQGGIQIETADQAAHALAPLVGEGASLLFMFGIIGTGLLAVPVLSGTASYAFCEVFGFREGLRKKWNQARIFYGVIGLSTLLGLLMNVFGINPVRALIYAAIANALVAGPLIFVILMVGNDRKTMKHYTNTPLSNVFGGLACFVMLALPIVWLTLTFMA